MNIIYETGNILIISPSPSYAKLMDATFCRWLIDRAIEPIKSNEPRQSTCEHPVFFSFLDIQLMVNTQSEFEHFIRPMRY